MQVSKSPSKIRTIIFFLLTFSLVSAGCSLSLTNEQTLDIRPLKDVYVSGPPQLTNITTTDAELLFDSSRPLACSVIYGTTTDYGMIAVDQDMGGGAHTDHNPLLLGLEPDTEYHYRLQGTAPDGVVYVSNDMTFRTPALVDKVEINLASLAAGARIRAVSSNFGGAANDETWGANSAIDGSRGTAWSSNGDGNDAYLEIQLSQNSRLEAVEVWTRTMSNGTSQIFSFTLTTDNGTVLGPFSLDDAEESYRFDIEVSTSSLRLNVVSSSGGNTGLIEFAVYGEPIK